MNNRAVVLFGIGFLVGYMVVRATRNNVVVNPKSENFPDTFAENIPPAMAGTASGSTQIKEPEVIETAEDPKITACKDKWIKFAETRRFPSAEQEQSTYNNFMTSCVAQS